MNEDLVERCCRAACAAIGVDPDKQGYGMGHTMLKGSTYPLWQAQRAAVQAVLLAAAQ